jgi:hypothetical protein
MRLPIPEITAAASPVAALVPLGTMPWYAHVLVGVSGPIVYLFRFYLVYRLARMALIEKTGRNGVELLRIMMGGVLKEHA